MKANIQIARVVRHIVGLGLAISESKTEAVLFRRSRLNVMPTVKVGDSYILVDKSMKYLGIKIDRIWSFRDHFNYVETKVNVISRALNRLMSNLCGPRKRKRRLYAMIMTSVMMYAAPVWGSAFITFPDRVLRPLRRLQRMVAIKVVAAYRTVSFEAATLLARMPPWFLEVALRNRIYQRICEAKRRDKFSRPEDKNIRREEGVLLVRQ